MAELQSASVVGSPEWWLQRLSGKLGDRKARLDKLDAYYRGDPPLPEGAQNAKAAYQAFQRKARTNYPKLIVDAPRHRMILTGFRTAASADDNGDKRAAEIMRVNGLSVESSEVHRIMLSLGDAYTIVGLDDDDLPAITAQDPRQVVTEHDPRRQRIVLAALNRFYDAALGADFAYVYLRVPASNAQLWVARRDRGTTTRARSGWYWDDDRTRELPIQRVPVVRFRNERGVGEFEEHLDHLDRINHMLLMRLQIATAQAFRQRMLDGNFPTVDEEGREINYDAVFSADPGAVWLLPPGAKLQEAAAVDLTPILQSVKDDVRDLAAVTSTPLPYVAPAPDNQSATGADLSKEALVLKAENRVERAKDGWAQTMSLAFELMGDTQRADLLAIEPMFIPPNRASLAERHDASAKAKADGVPWRTRMADILLYSPETIDRMAAERREDAQLEAQLAAIATPETTAAPAAA